jgi:4-oxalmesaconate hydratase
VIIDCHGHYTTAPKALETWRNRQIAGISEPAQMPKAAELKISDDELRESIETNQLKFMKERGADLRSSRRAQASWRIISATSP